LTAGSTRAKVKNHSLQAADFKAGQPPAGPKGKEGPPGREGPPGPGFGPDSGSAYELATIADATVAGGSDISFSGSPNLGANLAHTNGTTVFTIGSTGRYVISWVVDHAAGIGSALAIAVNGTVDATTNHNVNMAVGNGAGEATLSLTAGDVLTIRNNSAVPMTLDRRRCRCRVDDSADLMTQTDEFAFRGGHPEHPAR
jgi:collagen type I alpha